MTDTPREPDFAAACYCGHVGDEHTGPSGACEVDGWLVGADIPEMLRDTLLADAKSYDKQARGGG